MSREIMQQALDALEYHTMQTRPIHHTEKAIEAIKAALAQPEQEPVAWLVSDAQGRYATIRDPAPYGEEVYEPLYAAPPSKPWVGLTDEDAANISMQSDVNNWRDEQVIDAVEAKLKEKNNAV